LPKAALVVSNSDKTCY